MNSDKSRIWAFALIAACSAVASYLYGQNGIALALVWVACVLGLWPIRIKWGAGGREQWEMIFLKGKAYFLLVHFLPLFGILLVLTEATGYMDGHRIDNLLTWRLPVLFCVASTYGVWQWHSLKRKYSRGTTGRP